MQIWVKEYILTCLIKEIREITASAVVDWSCEHTPGLWNAKPTASQREKVSQSATSCQIALTY